MSRCFAVARDLSTASADVSVHHSSLGPPLCCLVHGLGVQDVGWNLSFIITSFRVIHWWLLSLHLSSLISEMLPLGSLSAFVLPLPPTLWMSGSHSQRPMQKSVGWWMPQLMLQWAIILPEGENWVLDLDEGAHQAVWGTNPPK